MNPSHTTVAFGLDVLWSIVVEFLVAVVNVLGIGNLIPLEDHPGSGVSGGQSAHVHVVIWFVDAVVCNESVRPRCP